MISTEHLRVFKLSDHLYGFYDGRIPGFRAYSDEPNWVDNDLRAGLCSYAVVSGKDALVYDTHVSIDHARVIRKTIEELGGRNVRVALSHWHLDHIAGNAVFSDCEIIGHRLTHAALLELREEIEGGNCDGPPAIKPLILPNTLIDEDLTLQIGGVTAELRPANVHSADGVVLYLPQIKTLLAGDTLEDTVTVVNEAESLATHIEELNRMWGWDIAHIFPNHGDPDVIANGSYGKALIRATQQYLRTLLRCAKEPELRDKPLMELIAGPLQAGWVHYFAPYQDYHRQNLARVTSILD
jgi:glyoxylase-like metal-dependent hydrolase (beta-lactamase superfamily II)